MSRRGNVISLDARRSSAMEVNMEATWRPHEKHGDLTERNAIARFDQTIGVSDEDRELAFANIKKAAEYYGVDMTETDWTQLGRTPHTGRTAEDRRKSARKAAATRKGRERGES